MPLGLGFEPAVQRLVAGAGFSPSDLQRSCHAPRRDAVHGPVVGPVPPGAASDKWRVAATRRVDIASRRYRERRPRKARLQAAAGT